MVNDLFVAPSPREHCERNAAGLLTRPNSAPSRPSSVTFCRIVLQDSQQRVCPGFSPDSLLITPPRKPAFPMSEPGLHQIRCKSTTNIWNVQIIWHKKCRFREKPALFGVLIIVRYYSSYIRVPIELAFPHTKVIVIT